MAKRTSRRRKKVSGKAAGKASAREFVASLKLSSIRLVESNTSLHIVGNALPQKMKVGVSMMGAMRIDGMFAVIVSTEVSGEAIKNKDSRLSIQSKYECLYKTASMPTEEAARAAGVVGVLAVWPYVREFTASMTNRMGLNQFVVPLARMNKDTGVVEIND